MESAESSQHDEAVLLLYLADELSSDQRVVMEQRLAGDQSFAAALNRLRGVDLWLIDSFHELDRTQPLPGTTGSWQRRIGRLIRQWQVRQAQLAPVAMPGRQIGGWAYTAAAAILVIVGYTAYWGFQSDRAVTPFNNSPIVSNDAFPIEQVPTGPRTDPILDYDQQPLADAEREVSDLAELTELRTSFQ